ncbi:hypothetical protein CIPAW_10G104100 [Carya illinoinensis]|uniref:RNase H type-1 domain-containing protein n=1 Tax=Carya illinoinensis TaxID=32201 RepID=A0A8T1PA06_CARIL|nr:hypothetical protein CIPAW_10G104100 [Carya illinoinensis]
MSKWDGGLGFRELEAFNQALLAKVGDGKSIRILKDKWIPMAVTYRIQLPLKMLNAEAKVKELIRAERKEWGIELVEKVFNEHEAQTICKLPVSFSGLPDKQIWAFSKNGMYIVKSAYHFEVNRKRREKGEVSGKSSEMNLKRRAVLKIATCLVCKNMDESVCHALWSCNGASDIWACERSPVQKWQSSEKYFFDLWSDWFSKLPLDQLVVMAVVLRGIWLRRNGLVFENKFEAPNIKQGKAQETGGVQSNNCHHWKLLVGDMVKVNWDAAMKSSENKGGIGVVARDNYGEVLVSLCYPRKHVADLVIAEVFALWRAMKLCEDLHFRNVQLEGDALSVVKVVNSLEVNWEWHGQLIEDLKAILHNRGNWKVVHVKRSCNNVAHSLAKLALNASEELVWMEDHPKEVLENVVFDKQCNMINI